MDGGGTAQPFNFTTIFHPGFGLDWLGGLTLGIPLDASLVEAGGFLPRERSILSVCYDIDTLNAIWYVFLAPGGWSVGALREKSASYGVNAFRNGGVVDDI